MTKPLAAYTESLTQEEAHSAVPMASRFGPDPNGDDIVSAASEYEFSLCDVCDNVHFWFLNDAGEYFATATFSTDMIDGVCKRLQDLKSQILKRSH